MTAQNYWHFYSDKMLNFGQSYYILQYWKKLSLAVSKLVFCLQLPQLSRSAWQPVIPLYMTLNKQGHSLARIETEYLKDLARLYSTKMNTAFDKNPIMIG